LQINLQNTLNATEEFRLTSHAADMTIQQTRFRGVIKGYLHANFTVQIPHFVSVFDLLIKAKPCQSGLMEALDGNE
jgi:hypothetical protein